MFEHVQRDNDIERLAFEGQRPLEVDLMIVAGGHVRGAVLNSRSVEVPAQNSVSRTDVEQRAGATAQYIGHASILIGPRECPCHGTGRGGSGHYRLTLMHRRRSEDISLAA